MRARELIDKYKPYMKNMADYFGASLIPMIVTVLANPVFAKFLSPKDYAIIGYYTSFNYLISPFVIFMSLHYYQRMFFRTDEAGRDRLRAMMTKTFLYLSLILMAIAIAVLAVYTRFNDNSDLPFLPYGILAVLPCWFINFYSLRCVDLKMQRQSKAYLKLNIVNMAFTTGTALVLVAIFKMGALGRMLGSLIGPMLMFILVFKDQRKYLSIKVSKSDFKAMLTFCTPLVASAMLEFFSKGYDKVCLEETVAIEVLGIYSVGYSFARYLNIFSNAISDTFSPDIFKSVSEGKFGTCAKFIGLQAAVVSVIATVFLLFSPILVHLLTAGRYDASLPYVKILSLSAISSCIFYACSQVVEAAGMTKITFLNKVIGSLVCIWLYSYMIGRWGASGAAWAVVCSYLIFLAGLAIIVFIYKFSFFKGLMQKLKK